MLTGKIKSYNPQMHLVSLLRTVVKTTCSFSKNAFPEDQYGTIQIGSPVEYVVVQGQKGPQAAKAHVIDKQPS